MKVILLDEKNLPLFKEYCYKYRKDHDESFLYDEDLEELSIENNNPGYLLIENDEIIGALSLVADRYYLAGKKARIRIFHCVEAIFEHYEMLLNALLPTNLEIEKIEMFIPNSLNNIKEIIEKLSFEYYRTSYVMIRKNKEKVTVSFEKGYELKPFVNRKDEIHYMNIRNIAFKNLRGSETPITLDDVKKTISDPNLLKNGIQILWHDDKPIGIIKMLLEREDDVNYSFVAPIALIPEYQGLGLGTKLLKAGIMIGYENDIDNSMLVVNGENEGALKLYKKVGYEVDIDICCYHLHL